MKAYEKPTVQTLGEVSEGVYAASGDDAEKKEKKVCRFGRTEANPGADTCQSCSSSGGVDANKPHTYRKDYTGCIDGMPEKQ